MGTYARNTKKMERKNTFIIHFSAKVHFTKRIIYAIHIYFFPEMILWFFERKTKKFTEVTGPLA